MIQVFLPFLIKYCLENFILSKIQEPLASHLLNGLYVLPEPNVKCTHMKPLHILPFVVLTSVISSLLQEVFSETAIFY